MSAWLPRKYVVKVRIKSSCFPRKRFVALSEYTNYRWCDDYLTNAYDPASPRLKFFQEYPH